MHDNSRPDRSAVLEILEQQEGHRLQGANLSGLDLTGTQFRFLSLEGVRFDGANLTGCLFQHVDLSGASLRNVQLDRSALRFVRASGTDFHNLHAYDTDWHWSSLTEADFSSARLKRTRFHNSSLEQATFDEADLSLGALTWSILDGVSFHETNLQDVETLGSSFRGANLSTARDFAFCREIVLEILSREADESLETMQWLGAGTLMRQWCYPVWADLLKDRPQLEQMIRAFRQYPNSGCLEALREHKHTSGT